MRFWLAVVVLAGVAGLVVWQKLEPPQPLPTGLDSFLLPEVTVVNPGMEPLPNHTLVIRDGKIQAVGSYGIGFELERDIAHYRGAYVLPGLIDTHTHLPPDNALELTPYFALLYLAHGVTSVRDAGDVDGTAVRAARRGIERGEFPGPRIFACGPFIAGGKPHWPNTIILREPSEADAVVAKLKQQGFDCVKAYDGLTLGQIHALRLAGTKHGLSVIGHVPAELRYEEALIPNVQHLFGVPEPESLRPGFELSRVIDWQDVDETRMQTIVDASLKYRIKNTPTLVSSQQLLLYRNYEAARKDPIFRLLPRLYRDVIWSPEHGLTMLRDLQKTDLTRLHLALEKKKKLTHRLYAAGAKLLIGTDTPLPFVVPGLSVHQEMRIFHELGIPVSEVWEIATREGGRELGLPLLGTIQQGAPADLLVFREDPTHDLDALATLEAVVVRGQLYSKQDIDAALARYQAHYDDFIMEPVSVLATRFVLAKTQKADE